MSALSWLKNSLQKRLLQMMMPMQKPHRLSTAFAKYETTTLAKQVDLSALSVINWAPVMLSQTEGLLLFTLIFSLRPERYVEIGTFKGGSALIAASAMDALDSSGRIVCVDPTPQIDPVHWQNLMKRATLLQGHSPEVLPRAYDIAGGEFDFVLIDGDHTAASVVRDANGVLPFVADGGYLLFHDSFSPQVASGIEFFAAQHAHEMTDFGTLNREVSVHDESDPEVEYWGGLRMMQVRRHVMLR